MFTIYEGTNTSPKVFYDSENNTLLIEGRSIDENPLEYIEKLYDWANKNFTGSVNLDILVKLTIYNSASLNNLINFFNSLEKKLIEPNKIKIIWFVHEGDEMEMEDVQEIKNILSLPVEIQYF